MGGKNRKNRSKKEKIRTGVSIGLGVLFAIAMGVMAIRIHMEDVERADNAVEASKTSPIKADRERDYGTPGFQKIAENERLILCADLTTGEISIEEKDTGTVWYSNPVDREQDTVVALKSRPAAQIVVNYFDVTTEVPASIDSAAGSVAMGGMDYEMIENGIRFSFSFPAAGMIIPVEYTLCRDGFEGRILCEEIQELWTEKYVALSIDLLPYFGAGGASDEGYLMVPDGSGALIDFNSKEYRFGPYSDMVYGRDLGTGSSKEAVKETVHMPVFGMKKNDGGFLAVITSGDANSRVYASAAMKASIYNQVYSTAVLREYKIKTIGLNANLEEENKRVNEYSQSLLKDCPFTVKYCFLGSEEADYSGMSRKYREYLESEGMLNESELADENYLILDLYGAVCIEKYMMGIKREVLTPMTTYEQVCDIVKELKDNGVENLIINYKGALSGGLEHTTSDRVKAVSCLGGRKEFNKMKEFLRENDVLLFMEEDPVFLYKKGGGFSTNKDAVKSFFDAYADQSGYALNYRETVGNGIGWFLFHPERTREIMERFLGSATKEGIENISMAGVGDYLYSDFSKGDRGISRTGTRDLFLESMENVRQSGKHLLVHGGNIYCAAWADVICDVPSGNSGFDIESSDIPFYQMTLCGNVVLGTNTVNESPDYRDVFLKAVETGSNLKFDFMYEDVSALIGTKYNDMVSYSYLYWKDAVLESYQELQEVAEQVKGEKIVFHEQVGERLFRTEYESGVSVLVNYNEEACSWQGHEIGGKGYLVVGGEGK